MEDLNKNAKSENPIVEKNDLKKGTVANAPKAPVKRIRVRTQAKPAASVLPKSDLVTAVEISNPIIEAPKASSAVSKKEKKPEVKIVVRKAPKMEKVEIKPEVQSVLLAVSKEEKKNPDSEKKVIKKNAKKAEQKVDKLKKRVKKAKKKEVKKSKLKSLKEKLKKALDKFKDKIEKLKEAKK